MKAVLLVGGFSTTLRPITMSLPQPLLEFCNNTFLMHQLRALKDAGVSEVRSP
jgi:mannose-1-phosphate guanylyltransferase